MNSKLRYLCYRIQVCGIVLCILFVLLWCIALRLAFSKPAVLAVVILAGVLFLVLAVIVVFKIVIPFYRQERMIGLFSSGYTATGLEDSEFAVSPSIEQFFLSVSKMLSSDEILKANKRQAQYLALQNQINPHFLYNTLESIRSEAMEAGIENVTNMTEALANFFRYTISKVENMVTLEEELENVKTYFYIQKYRFEERINLSIEYEPEEWEFLQKCLIPKLTLQPVVENSIIHGLERKLGSGTVRIILHCTKNRLNIQVSDDGVGMAPDVLETLTSRLKQPVLESVQASQKGGIAIVNVNNRIHLIFGEEYGISVYSTPDFGTDTVISLPLATSKRQIRHGEELK